MSGLVSIPLIGFSVMVPLVVATRRVAMDTSSMPECCLVTLTLYHFCFPFQGGIHGTPVPPNFSFEVNSSMEIIHRPFSSNAVINCNTNDASAIVTLEKLHPQKPSNVPVEEGKITRNGSVFTIYNIIVHDGGKYQCVAEKNGQVIKREILLIVDTSMC